MKFTIYFSPLVEIMVSVQCLSFEMSSGQLDTHRNQKYKIKLLLFNFLQDNNAGNAVSYTSKGGLMFLKIVGNET